MDFLRRDHTDTQSYFRSFKVFSLFSFFIFFPPSYPKLPVKFWVLRNITKQAWPWAVPWRTGSRNVLSFRVKGSLRITATRATGWGRGSRPTCATWFWMEMELGLLSPENIPHRSPRAVWGENATKNWTVLGHLVLVLRRFLLGEKERSGFLMGVQKMERSLGVAPWRATPTARC